MNVRFAVVPACWLALAYAEPVHAYGGEAADAAWRAEAETRIDQARKADYSLTFTRPDGTPIQGAAVRVMQQEHAFRFGTAVGVNQVLGDDPEDQLYRDKLLDLGFNTATIENSLKWQAIAGEFGPNFGLDPALQTIDWLEANGLDVRGHVLVWPGTDNLPDAIDTLIDQTNNNVPGARDALEQAVVDHIQSTAGATAGRLVDWDVVNEIGSNRDLIDIFGESEMDDWFAAARAADPAARLFINEFDIITDHDRDKRVSYLNQVQGLVDRGAPIDGIGMQAHFFQSGGLTDIGPGGDPQTVWDVLDQFHDATGLPIAITEYDLTTNDEQLKADYLRDFLTAVFAHEAVTEFTMWGFWEGRHWRPDAAMINQDFTETPMAAAWRDLVTDQWWTDASEATDSEGKIDLRVFQGDYLIEVDIDGQTLVFTPTIGPDGYELTLAHTHWSPDLNGDGDVDHHDVNLAIANYTGEGGSTAMLPSDGDVDGDGDVDNDDLGYLMGAYDGPLSLLTQIPPIPEPASLALLGWGGLLVSRRRRG